MTPAELAYRCAAVMNAGGSHISLVKPTKMPKGFPRGEFQCETHRGKIYSYDVERVLAWLVANGMAAIAASKENQS